MGLFSKKTPERTLKVEEPPEELASIKYVSGSGGKGSKGHFLVGKTLLPVRIINFLETACQGKPDQKQAFIIHSSLPPGCG